MKAALPTFGHPSHQLARWGVLASRSFDRVIFAAKENLTIFAEAGNINRWPLVEVGMKRSFNPASVPTAIALESLQVASPCHADWNAMRGDDRSRFCPSCAKNVYNLSAMTRPEAELLLQEKEGRLCVRYYLREDGTMLTQDCPVGVAALKQRSPSFALWAGVASLFVLVGALLSPTLITGAHAQPDPQSGQIPAQTATPTSESQPTAEPPLDYEMGDVAIALPPTAVPTPTPTVAEPTNGAIKGEMSVVPTPAATPRQLVPLMGKPSMPKATPTPQAMPTRMGRIAAPRTVPTPAPTPNAVPLPMMGAIALPPTTHPGKKTPLSPKKRNSPTTKQR